VVQAGLSVWLWAALAAGELGTVWALVVAKVGAGVGVWFLPSLYGRLVSGGVGQRSRGDGQRSAGDVHVDSRGIRAQGQQDAQNDGSMGVVQRMGVSGGEDHVSGQRSRVEGQRLDGHHHGDSRGMQQVGGAADDDGRGVHQRVGGAADVGAGRDNQACGLRGREGISTTSAHSRCIAGPASRRRDQHEGLMAALGHDAHTHVDGAGLAEGAPGVAVGERGAASAEGGLGVGVVRGAHRMVERTE
jgi:hypothetical protein